MRRRPEIREALERIWPIISGAELINELFGFKALIASATPKLGEAERALLYRPRADDARSVVWTDADVALVDEAESLLGPVEAALPRAKRRRGPTRDALAIAERVIENLEDVGAFTNATEIAERYGAEDSRDESTGEVRTFGHVLVDEAQDLTIMQWRMLARRCPTGSFTIVGDLGQASRPGAIDSWDAVLRELPGRIPPRIANLTVNYRTPAEIMHVAARLLAAAAPGIAASRSVRTTGNHPRFAQVAESELVTGSVREALAVRAEGGTVAVIAPSAAHGEILAMFNAHGTHEAAAGAAALDAPIAVLDGTESKGLEFDHVIVVEPADLVAANRAGLRLLYVTITRATKTLVVVHNKALPEALEN